MVSAPSKSGRRTARSPSSAWSNRGPLPTIDVLVVVLGQREHVACRVAREPRARGVGVDAFGQQHLALPRGDATRRLELGRRQVAHPVVGDVRDGERRAARGRQGGAAERGVGRAPGVDLVAAAAPGDGEHGRRAGRADRQHRRGERDAAALLPAVGQRRLGDGRRFEALHDATADRDALVGVEPAELGAVHVAVGDELAAAGGAGRAAVALRIVEREAGDDDLEVVGGERLAGVDDVEEQAAARQLGGGQRVGEHVAVLAAHGLVRVADADARVPGTAPGRAPR